MASNNVSAAIKRAKAKAVTQQVLGWIITAFCAMVTSVGAGTSGFKETIDVVMVTMFAAFTALGILLIVKGYKRKKLIKNFYDYSARLSVDPDKSIDLLSSSTGNTITVVTNNIADMITLGFFPGAFLDTAHNRVVMQNAKPSTTQPVVNTAVNTPTQSERGVKYVTVQCKNCGATNKIIAGTVGECEFCGSQISDN